MPLYLKDLSKPAIDSPLLQEIAKRVQEYGLGNPEDIMGVGAPRIPQSTITNRLPGPWNQIMGRGSQPADGLTKFMLKDLPQTLLARGIKQQLPEGVQQVIDHPGDTLMKWWKRQ